MICECSEGHISFSKDNLNICGMSGCGKATLIISPIDIKWFYKIQEKGLCIHRKDLYKIIEDPNMPKDVKKQIKFFNIYEVIMKKI
jgi:ABC-type dipeptide/oligopeptide/nickel transport system ATPase component